MQPLKSLFFMLLWSCFYVITMSLNKFISPETPTTLILFYRGVIALMWLTPIIIKNGGLSILTKSKIPHLHLARGILVTLVTACTYYSYRYLPLHLATIIGFSGPLFTCLIATFFLKEHLTPQKILCILIGYLGVFCIVRPTSIDWSFTIFIALLGNVLIGGVITLLKRISQEDDTLTILFYTTLIPMCFWGTYAISNFHIPNMQDLFLLFLIGFSGLSLQFCYAKAITFEDASFVAPLEYLRLLIAFPVSILVFDETWHPYVLVGGILIVSATYILLRIESKNLIHTDTLIKNK